MARRRRSRSRRAEPMNSSPTISTARPSRCGFISPMASAQPSNGMARCWRRSRAAPRPPRRSAIC
ncbi:hypothetical protein FJ971_09985 [Mesorhizobium sp. B2-1-2]|nr:hypothetical protein FJ971_09985 [Mesorhizobium sp. B2-1-2]